MKLVDFLRSQGCKSVDKINGPNGAFLSVTNADGTTSTMPIGNKSKDGKIADYEVLHTTDKETGQPMVIATLSQYETTESLEL